jgi:aryl-alcohol dehydrogenase-like predicted oxidoreductase
VLSGAVSAAQLRANVAALRLDVPADLGAELGLTEPAAAYWSARAERSWS